jgi:hypothetical protein
MTLLPILTRELRGRARSRATYWSRFAVALLGVLICLPETFFAGPLGLGFVTGRRVFDGIVGAAFLLSCSACVLAADVISAERREGTLGLLFLTRVKTPDVLLGKLASVGVMSMGALVAFLPVLLVPVMAGGVSGAEAFRKALALLATLLFALAAGLFGSAARRERAKSVRDAVLVVSLVVLAPFVMFVTFVGGAFRVIGAFSPLVLLNYAGDASFAKSPGAYWGSLGIVIAMAVGLMFAAGRRLRRVASDWGGETPPPKVVEAESERAVGLYRWQPAREEGSPIEWLVYRQQGVTAAMWMSAVVALAYSGVVLWVHEPLAPAGAAASPVVAWPLGIAGALIGGAMVAWVASRFFVGVRRTGDLELLLTTPVGAESLVSDQWRALRRLFVRNVPLVQAAMLLPVLGSAASRGGGAIPEWHAYNTISMLLSLGNALLGTSAVCWLALWFALRMRSQAAAIAWTVGIAKGLPCVVSVLVLGLGAVLFGFSVGPPVPGEALVAWLPEVGLLFFYGWLARTARRKLRDELEGVESRTALARTRRS